MNTTLPVTRKFITGTWAELKRRKTFNTDWSIRRESAPFFGSFETYLHKGIPVAEFRQYGKESGFTINPQWFHDNGLWCPCGSH